MIRKTSDGDERWLDLDGFAEVDVSRPKRRCTQSSLHCLLRPQTESSWEAAEPGPQTVRILFDRPQRIDNVLLEFQEFQLARTQEFLLRWSSNGGKSYREIVRQQYNFSPPTTTVEREHYSIDLADMTNIELTIIPDISGESARASLSRLRMGPEYR